MIRHIRLLRGQRKYTERIQQETAGFGENAQKVCSNVGKVVDKYVPIPGANDLLDGPATIEKVTGDSTDLVRGGVDVLIFP